MASAYAFGLTAAIQSQNNFLDVLGTGKTLLQSTFERFLPICPAENIYVVTHEEHAHLVKQQLPQHRARSDLGRTDAKKYSSMYCLCKL